jgi:hypothetical protein
MKPKELPILLCTAEQDWELCIDLPRKDQEWLGSTGQNHVFNQVQYDLSF